MKCAWKRIPCFANKLCESVQTLTTRSKHFSTVSSNSCALPFFARGLIRLIKAPIKTLTFGRDGKYINRHVWNLLDLNVKASNEAEVASMDVSIDQQQGVWARLYIPCVATAAHGCSRLPVIFHFHGGGFALLRGSTLFYDRYCKLFCKKGRVVISVDYRRPPEYRCPTAYQDCFSALLWLHKQVMEDDPRAAVISPHTNHIMHDVYRADVAAKGERAGLVNAKLENIHLADFCDLSRCFLIGDSAGGNIVYHVASMAAAAGSSLSPLRIVGCMLLFPFFGGEQRTASELQLANQFMLDLETSDWLWKAFLPQNANRDHPASNVPKELLASMGIGSKAHPTQGFMAPWLVAVAEHDPLKDRQLEYVQALQKGRKPVRLHYYESGFHCFHLFTRPLSLIGKLQAHLESFIRVQSV
ncbi:hypothetical protein L7F22_046352 [Adiantum nelumboides]|nr:hypothetical protein [Adiantum nelumboides]